MSEIIIDHEAAKLTAEQAINIDAIAGGHVNLRHLNLSRAYLDLHAQLAAERERVAALEDTNNQRYRDLAGLLQIWNNLCETLTNTSGRNSQQIPVWNMPTDETPSERAMNYITELAAERDNYKQQLTATMEDRDNG